MSFWSRLQYSDVTFCVLSYRRTYSKKTKNKIQMHYVRLPAGPCDDASLWLHSFSPPAKDCNWSPFPHTAGRPFAASRSVAFTCLTWVITPMSLDGRVTGFGGRLAAEQLIAGSYRVCFVQKSLCWRFLTNNKVKKQNKKTPNYLLFLLNFCESVAVLCDATKGT